MLPLHRSRAALLVVIGTWLSAGCAANNYLGPDPLLGERQQAQPYSRQTSQPPAAPASTGGRNTASLAANARSGFSNEHRLAIDRPQPDSAGRPVAPTSWGKNGSAWEEAKAALSARGVTWQQTETLDGQCHFRCSVPNPSNPNLSRQYEASAADEISAMQGVLDRMNAEQR